MQHCDKAGPSSGLGMRGEKKASRTEHFHPRLTFQITKNRPSQISPQVNGLRREDPLPHARRQRNETKWRHRPPPPTPLAASRHSGARRPYARSPSGSHRKTKAQLEGNEAPGWCATAASRLYIPFEAMSAHARTGQQATRFQHHRAPTPRGLSSPASCVEVYVRLPAYVPRRNVPNAERKGGEHGRTPTILQGI